MIIRQLSEKQIKELKKEINKTEYEKAREPLKQEIKKMREYIFYLEKREEAYQQTINEIIKSLNDDYIKLMVKTNPIEVQFGEINDIQLTQSPYQLVTIPIKEQFRYSIYQRLSEISKGDSNE